MAKKVNQFAQVIADVRRELADGRKVAAKANVETVQASLRKIDPKNDPIRQSFVDQGFSLTRLKKRRIK